GLASAAVLATPTRQPLPSSKILVIIYEDSCQKMSTRVYTSGFQVWVTLIYLPSRFLSVA
ncbi:MAG: hypothetical protein LPD71_01635, partial [Shewanella sp.]|nr:hypothetical protein [Shewanella sp.]